MIDKLKKKNDELIPNKTLEDILNSENEKENKENLEFYIKENELLNNEINSLKEQLIIKNKDNIEIKKLNDENIKLKIKNEELLTNNKNIKNKLDEYQKQEIKNKLISMKNKLSNTMTKLRSANNNKEKENYEKQINALKKLREEEKNNYESQIKKIKMELVVIKMKNAKQQNTINSMNEKIKNLNLKDNKNKENKKVNEKQNSNPFVPNFQAYLFIVIVLFIMFWVDNKF